tara:strand:- start:6496 stop:7782 length:1287 start_codon:yes stop_codon:yes gene_type:complete
MNISRGFKLDSTSDLQIELDRITYEVCQVIPSTRVSIWIYNAKKNLILCKSLYCQKAKEHSSGQVLLEKDYAEYFNTLKQERFILAPDVHTHEATRCFSESYSKPLAIESLYDAPIRTAEKMIGVLCIEYFEVKDYWSSEERYFINSIADYLGKVYEKYKVLELVESLEFKVKKRTSELEKTLKKLKDTQQVLVEREKLAGLGTIVAGVAHELKNPLNLILNSNEALIEIHKKKQNRDQSLENLLFVIKDAANRANNIIKDMLGSSKDREEKVDVNLTEIIEMAMKLAMHGNSDNDFRLHHQIKAPELINIKAAREKMQRVFINIFENSIYALRAKCRENTSYSPQLDVKAITKDHSVFVKITDNGCGIPQEKVKRVFEPFYSSKVEDGGTGLGLSLVYNIIKEHEGEISLTSEYGEGTEIEIILPLK